MEEAVREGRPPRETARLLEERVGAKAHAARVAVATASAAYDRAARVETAHGAAGRLGVPVRFKYAGPPPERGFCRTYIGRVLTRDEILALPSQQGLPPLYYGGGYGCRHRWVVVLDEPEAGPPGGAGLVRADLDAARAAGPRFSERDLRQDALKHAGKFGLSAEGYAEEAARVARTADRVLVKRYKDEGEQFWLFGGRGTVIMDPDGTIRGYFFHRDPDVSFEHFRRKTDLWKPIRD